MLACHACNQVPDYPWAEVLITPMQAGAVLCARCVKDLARRQAIANMYQHGYFGARATLRWRIVRNGNEQEHEATVHDSQAVARFVAYD